MKSSELLVKIPLKGSKRSRTGTGDVSGGAPHAKRRPQMLSNAPLVPESKQVNVQQPSGPDKPPSFSHVRAWVKCASTKELQLLSEYLEQKRKKISKAARDDKGTQQTEIQPLWTIPTEKSSVQRRKNLSQIQQVRPKVSILDVERAEAALRGQKMSLADRWDRHVQIEKPAPPEISRSEPQNDPEPANVFETLFATAQSRYMVLVHLIRNIIDE